MSSPNRMSVADKISTNFDEVFTEGRDVNLIENIISDSLKTGDPRVLENNIGKIISQVSPDRQPMALKFLQNTYDNLLTKQKQAKQNQALQQVGIDQNLPEGLQKVAYENQLLDRRARDIMGDQGIQPQQTQGIQGAQQSQRQPLYPQQFPGMESELEEVPASPQQQPTPNSQAPTKGIDYSKLSDEQLVRLGSVKGYSQSAKLELDRRKAEKKASQSVYEPEAEKLEAKRVAELSDQIENEYAAAKNEDMRLDRMTVVDKDKNVSTPALVKFLDAFGLPIGILANPKTEEYRKLESDFVRDVSKIFPGGKITNYEIQSYLRTIPNLMNSPEGRAAIIRNRKLINEAKKVRYDEYKKIIKENNGKKPQNLGILLEERTAGRMADIENKFISGISDAVETNQVPIRMVDPKGNPIDIPPNRIEQAMKAGARFQ